MVMDEQSKWVILNPPFSTNQDAAGVFSNCATALAVVFEKGDIQYTEIIGIRQVAWQKARRLSKGELRQPVRFALTLLCDLVSQGWGVRVVDGIVEIGRPDTLTDREQERERVRKSLLLARNEQLSTQPIRRFLKSMESKRLGPNGWVSIHSLMRDGVQLAEDLAEIASLSSREEQFIQLQKVISPYLQFVTADERCEHTGFRLSDIWRYFRFTWLTPVHSVPGRNMMILIRDAAVKSHPVIGIAALASSIVQQHERDVWIGWLPDVVLDAIAKQPDDETADWLFLSLDRALTDIDYSDFVESGIITENDIREPSDEVIAHLQSVATIARQQHQASARTGVTRRLQAQGDWHALWGSALYRWKRAQSLAVILGARIAFINAGFTESTGGLLCKAMAKPSFRKAVSRVVRMAKSARVGINMMDISVAGAIAPYNALIGGKLVSLLLASPEVINEYSRRYNGTPSVIASAMKGKPVYRDPQLVLLCTTGLFAGGSIQYNRIHMPATAAGGSHGQVRFCRLKQNTSYSTFHISQFTMEEMKCFFEQDSEGSDVHGIFGEGVNPKMRKLRDAFERIGFPPDEILQAGSPRTIYTIPLTHNYRDVLLGRTGEPAYILPVDNPCATTDQMVGYWQNRWVVDRIGRTDLLDTLRQHCTNLPTSHGAVVIVPEVDNRSDLFNFSEGVDYSLTAEDLSECAT